MYIAHVHCDGIPEIGKEFPFHINLGPGQKIPRVGMQVYMSSDNGYHGRIAIIRKIVNVDIFHYDQDDKYKIFPFASVEYIGIIPDLPDTFSDWKGFLSNIPIADSALGDIAQYTAVNLLQAGYKTLGDLVLSEYDLLTIRNIGIKDISRISQAMAMAIFPAQDQTRKL